MVSAGEQVWRKKYPSMEAATSEAEELHIMSANDKGLADLPQPVPTYAQGFSSPSVDVDLEDLIKRGFLLDTQLGTELPILAGRAQGRLLLPGVMANNTQAERLSPQHTLS